MRIPPGFELPGEDAIMRKEGSRLIIEPAPPQSLLALLATLALVPRAFFAHSRPASRSRRSLIRYLLDAHVASDRVRNAQANVAQRIRKVGENRACTMSFLGRSQVVDRVRSCDLRPIISKSEIQN